MLASLFGSQRKPIPTEPSSLLPTFPSGEVRRYSASASIRNVDEKCYSLLCLVNFFLDKKTNSSDFSHLIKLHEEFISVDEINFLTGKWKYAFAWIGKEPTIFTTFIGRNIEHWYIDPHAKDYKDKYVIRERRWTDDYFEGRAFIESRDATLKMGGVNYSNVVIWRIPEYTRYPFYNPMGLEFNEEEIPIINVRTNEPKKGYTFSEFWCFESELMLKVMNIECELKDTQPRKTILLRHAQFLYDKSKLNLQDTAIADRKKLFESEFKQDSFIVKNQNDYMNSIVDVSIVFPLFLLFAFQDLKHSNIPLSNIVNLIDNLISKHFRSLLVEKLELARQFWLSSFEESENFEIEHKSIVSIIRNQIKNRTISDQSIRMFLNALCCMCTFYQSESMFLEIVKLSNSLYNWFKYAN